MRKTFNLILIAVILLCSTSITYAGKNDLSFYVDNRLKSTPLNIKGDCSMLVRPGEPLVEVCTKNIESSEKDGESMAGEILIHMDQEVEIAAVVHYRLNRIAACNWGCEAYWQWESPNVEIFDDSIKVTATTNDEGSEDYFLKIKVKSHK